MNDLNEYKRSEQLPHSACAAHDLEAFVLLDAVRRYPGYRKGLLTAAALGVLGSNLHEDRTMLVYIDSLVTTKCLHRHNFGYYLTPGGVERLEQLKSRLRGPLMRSMT